MTKKNKYSKIGSEDRKYLTVEALNIIEKSDVLIGSKRSLELFNMWMLK